MPAAAAALPTRTPVTSMPRGAERPSRPAVSSVTVWQTRPLGLVEGRACVGGEQLPSWRVRDEVSGSGRPGFVSSRVAVGRGGQGTCGIRCSAGLGDPKAASGLRMAGREGSGRRGGGVRAISRDGDANGGASGGAGSANGSATGGRGAAYDGVGGP